MATERRVKVERELLEREVKVERENIIVNDIGSITGVFPDGTLDIVENGTYNVAMEKYAEVNVPGVEDAFNADITKSMTSAREAQVYFANLLTLFPEIEVAENVTSLEYIGQQQTWAYVANGKDIRITGGGSVLRSIAYVAAGVDQGANRFGARTVDLSGLSVNPSGVAAERIGVTSVATKIVLPSQEVNITNLYNSFLNALVEEIDFGGLVVASTGINTNGVFSGCSALKRIIFRREDTVCAMNSNAFSYSTVESGTCLIYVPDSLVNAYKAHKVWGTYADQIKPLSELPEEET